MELTEDILLECGMSIRLWIGVRTPVDPAQLPSTEKLKDSCLEISKAEHFVADAHTKEGMLNLAIAITKLPNINAVQVKNKSGGNSDGVMIYTVDF